MEPNKTAVGSEEGLSPPQRANTTAGDQRPPDDPTPRYPFPIVGIGASAGGLEAFRQLL